MSSLISGFVYDIFISYRQNDNKYDGWVTEFVNNLKKELEATFKEEISVYFDINPHDGLLETHDVGASLKEKLKCLVFIPIISQTYCDSKCFAWQHEFCAFNNQAKEDQFGRDIRLYGGNVASRILPVKIHDLDPDDKLLLETELGGVLRSIEFIYRSAGVNRSLRANEDHPQDNLNKTYYRDQINKVANAVKEIIAALKKYDQPEREVTSKISETKPGIKNNLKLKVISGSFLVLALIVLGYFFVPKLFKSSEIVEKSIAVLPFENMSDDEEHAWLGDAMTDEIILQLYKVNEFVVRSRNSVMQFKATIKTSPEIGNELNVNYLIGGSVQRHENQIKIRVQLINSRLDTPLWGETFDGNWQDIMTIQSEIAKQIADKLKTVLSPEEIFQIDKKATANPEAYNSYLKGNDYYLRSFNKENFEIAIKMYSRAIELDPNFAHAYVNIAQSYLQLHWFYYDNSADRLVKAKRAIDAAFRIDPDLPEAHLAMGNYYYIGFLNYTKAIEQLQIAQNGLANNSDLFYVRANIYRRAGEWELSEKDYLKAYELDPTSPAVLHNVGVTASLLKEYQKAEEFFNKALQINPAFIEAVWQKWFLYLKWQGNLLQAGQTLDEAFQFNECKSDPLMYESSVLLAVYANDYPKALSKLSSNGIDFIFVQFYVNLKSLLYARVYDLMNMPQEADKYYKSAMITLDSMILRNPVDDRLFSAKGIALAGLGQKEKAIEAGKRAVDIMKIEREAYRGVFRAEDLAKIYVMVGEYDAALEQIKLLLAIPSRLSVKLLLLDPAWKPLWDLPEFKKIIN
ncbi:MAG: tetratricopeptide repeat protein [Bacteroidales bacterium]|nr:tetratricopeptide repeat protein [Bacteroidales bacterium]